MQNYTQILIPDSPKKLKSKTARKKNQTGNIAYIVMTNQNKDHKNAVSALEFFEMFEDPLLLVYPNSHKEINSNFDLE